jgi:hypothetical protein
VTFSRCRYGPRDERGIPDVCYAQYFDQEFGIWDVLSRHRSPGAAMPPGMEQMGWRNGNYSMRRAMTALGGALELRCGEEVAA